MMTLSAQQIRQGVLQLMPRAKRLVLAVSGGPDSVALARALVGQGFGLELAHFDHALRPESPEDAAFVRELATELALPFHHSRADVRAIAAERKWNLEDAARRLRYAFLTRTAKKVGADAVATGHSLDDQAETVLMQLLRGAAYLKGMPARQGRVIRPLLAVSREEILEYLAGREQAYRIDHSNADISRTRAWLRGELLPQLEARYPKVKQTLARHARLQQEQAGHFDRLSRRFIREGVVVTGELTRADLAVKRHTLAQLLQNARAPFRLEHIDRLLERLETTSPFRLSLSADHQVRIAYGALEIVNKLQGSSAPLPQQLPDSVDARALAAFPAVHYRHRASGDRICLAGGTKKVSDLLIDKKIPRERRDALWLLASGQEVLWIDGVATDVRVERALANADVHFMRVALAQAEQALNADELPVGAIVVKDGEIIGVGHNTSEQDHDPTSHAEMHAIRQASKALGDWRLTGCTLFVTLEPCPMCFGAALSAHLTRLVYGAGNEREGALGGVSDLQQYPWKRRLEIREGVLAKEGKALLKGFFSKKRSHHKNKKAR